MTHEVARFERCPALGWKKKTVLLPGLAEGVSLCI